ncbi:MAG: hypothetical protein QXL94_07850 [Candidatus Parvarchaeum sp.]
MTPNNADLNPEVLEGYKQYVAKQKELHALLKHIDEETAKFRGSWNEFQEFAANQFEKSAQLFDEYKQFDSLYTNYYNIFLTRVNATLETLIHKHVPSADKLKVHDITFDDNGVVTKIVLGSYLRIDGEAVLEFATNNDFELRDFIVYADNDGLEIAFFSRRGD